MTLEELADRHRYCVTPGDIIKTIRRSGWEILPGGKSYMKPSGKVEDIVGVCDHVEDFEGLDCNHGLNPSPAIIERLRVHESLNRKPRGRPRKDANVEAEEKVSQPRRQRVKISNTDIANAMKELEAISRRLNKKR